MPSYTPIYRVQFFRPASFGATQVRLLAELQTLLRADLSLPVTGGVGQASLVFADPKSTWLKRLALQPMDVVRVWCNSRLKKTPVVAWTGFITDAYAHWDNQQYGQTLVVQATSPYYLWEMTPFLLSTDKNAVVNDAATLALASATGVGARDLIKFTANRVKYPGPLGALTPSPAGLQLYGTDPTTGQYTQPEYVGLRSYSLPDNIWSDPSLQNYSTVLQGLTADTGMVLYCDEFGSLCFKPVPWLDTPSNPRILDPIEIVDSVFDTSEQGIYTEVRVAFQNTYVYTDYAIGPQAGTAAATAMTNLEKTIGRRVLTIDARWLNNQESAQFLASQLVRQYAAGIAKGQVTILADPGCRTGSVIGAPAPDGSGVIQYYGVSNVIDSWIYGGPWLRTLQLVYGRDQRQSYPLVGVLQAPAFSKQAASGVPGGAGSNYVNPLAAQQTTGKQSTVFTVVANSAVAGASVWAPFPVGTILQIRDTKGNPLPDGTKTGEYKVTQTLTGTQSLTIEMNNPGSVTQATVVIIKLAQTQDSSTAAQTPSGSTTTSTKLTPSGSGSSGTAVSTATKTLGYTPQNLAQTALGAALSVAGDGYAQGTQGQNTPPTWDCSGLVWWAYTVAQYGWTRTNAGEQYRYWLAHGANEIALINATAGDLLFFGDMFDATNQHVGFLHTITPAAGGTVSATMFSAMNTTQGIGDCDVAQFHTEQGNGLAHVLNMQQVTRSS